MDLTRQEVYDSNLFGDGGKHPNADVWLNSLYKDESQDVMEGGYEELKGAG